MLLPRIFRYNGAMSQNPKIQPQFSVSKLLLKLHDILQPGALGLALTLSTIAYLGASHVTTWVILGAAVAYLWWMRQIKTV
jgi:hypothetical protein